MRMAMQDRRTAVRFEDSIFRRPHAADSQASIWMDILPAACRANILSNEASRPLCVLERCLQQLRDGAFKADETKSGRFIDALLTSDVQLSVKLETVDLSSEDDKVEGSLKTFQSECLVCCTE